MSVRKTELMFINHRRETLYYIITHQIRNIDLYEMIYDFPEHFIYHLGTNVPSPIRWLYSANTNLKVYPNNDIVQDNVFYLRYEFDATISYNILSISSIGSELFSESESESESSQDPYFELESEYVILDINS